MSNEGLKNTAFPLIFSIVIVLLLAWHMLICCDYPYYTLWDMDLAVTLDTVLIHSGLLPDHINHTAFGTNLLLFFTEKIADFFDTLSTIELEDVANSLNPLAGMVELTEFIRLHSPILTVSIAAMLCLAIRLMFGMSRWYILFFLAFLGAQESLTYHSSLIRSELYSVFYWAAAAVIMAIAVKARTQTAKWALLWVMGFLLGLCFLTKIQALFYIIALVALLFLAFSIFKDPDQHQQKNITRKNAYWILAISAFNVIAFAGLCAWAYPEPIPKGIYTWANSFGITPIAVLLFSALLSLLLVQAFLLWKNKLTLGVFQYCSFLTIIAAGFILSFLSHFLLYSDPAVSLRYMLLDFKMMFLRDSTLLEIQSLSSYISNFFIHVRYNPTLFIVTTSLILLLILGHRFRFIKITKGQLALCLLLTAIAFGNILVGVRVTLKDILWEEVLLNFLNLFYFVFLVTQAIRYRTKLKVIGLGLLIVLFFVNCIHSHNIPKKIDASFNQYGWWEDRWFGHVYKGNQLKYEQIMRKKYTAVTAHIAKEKVPKHKQIKKTVNFVFKDQPLTHKNIGIAFAGFSAWNSSPEYKIKQVPDAIKGAILVDIDSLRQNWPSDYISLLTRRDLKIYLFAEAEDIAGLLNREVIKTPYKVIVQNDKEAIELHGLEIRKLLLTGKNWGETNALRNHLLNFKIKEYFKIPLDKINHRFFFVINKI